LKVYRENGLPIKAWLDDIEDGALKQAYNLAELPFVYKHIALMPDAHVGYGMPIGGIMATKGVVVPYAVGYDIGCGMCVCSLGIKDISKEDLKKVMGLIRKRIPVGKNWHKEMKATGFLPDLPDNTPIVEREYAKARKQVGTLGGGNHFIEIQKGSGGYIHIMIHSGSRNLGHQVAGHYNKVAVELNERWFSKVPKEWQLAFLPTDTDEGRAYMAEMEYCLKFARKNRAFMMNEVIKIFVSEGISGPEETYLDVAHNYAAWENHFGQNVIVHRKGATRAYEGERGIIPGSQGAFSYIVKGKGHEMAFKSCSHGAGRKMGRKDAIRSLDMAEQIDILDAKGVIHSVRNKGNLDEAPGAYKDIAEVMANQSDLVDIEVELTPLAVIKG